MKTEKKITISIIVCYATMALLACIDGDATEALGWICAAEWAMRELFQK